MLADDSITGAVEFRNHFLGRVLIGAGGPNGAIFLKSITAMRPPLFSPGSSFLR